MEVAQGNTRGKVAAGAEHMEETEFFINVFQAERSLWTVKSKNHKDRDFGAHSQERFVVFFLFKPKFVQ